VSLEPRDMPVAESVTDIWAKLRSYAERTTPSTFTLRTELLTQGRSDTPLAATDALTLVLKVYASGGENELHAHPQEDHAFVVLAGRAQFHGPAGEQVVLGPLQGIMLPRGSFYRFHAQEGEALVLLRVGTPANHRMPRPTRIDIDGAPMHGDSAENRTVPPVRDAGRFFG
jgi:mannose-6-phosphate isomerase-like protein (cupin superfamily)